jgi:uncharacterized membrane-anchored protein/uncharacterized membrane protein
MKRLTSITYFFGVFFILASALYFFASNWQAFSRIEKVFLSSCLILLFYGASFVLDRVLKRIHFIPNWLLVCGVISFGLSVALIGQLYNSHADSYLLFLVWAVPSLLFSLITRYNGFYVLTHILIHLTIYFYLFPDSPFREWDLLHTLIVFGVSLLNAILFILTNKRYIDSKPLLYMSLITANILFIVTTIGNEFSFIFSMIYIVLAGLGLYIHFRSDTSIVVTISLFATSFVLVKMFTMMVRNFSNLFFIGLLLASMLLLAVSVFLINYLRKEFTSRSWVKNLFIACVTSVASIFLVASVFGLLSLLMMDISMITLFIFSTVVLVIPSTLTSWPLPVRYSLIMTGIIIGMISSTFEAFSYIMFFVLAFVIYFEKHPAAKVVFYALFQMNIGITLARSFDFGVHPILIIVFLINLIIYFKMNKRQSIQYAAFFISLSSFFSLTSITLPWPLHMLYTILFFAVVMGGLYYFKNTGQKIQAASSFVFLILLIAQVYYDLAWKLVHKSILFIILGLLFITAAVYLDKKYGTKPQKASLLKGRLTAIVLIISLQAAWMGYQVYSNERLLQHGETVTLELQPVDPRSLLQGDYVQLNYTISQLDTSTVNEKGPITIVLRENEKGVHQYAGIYKFNDKWNTTFNKKPGDILLAGKVTEFWNQNTQVEYGIENFFVPEGTGLEVENTAKFAVVKVSENGNGILYELKSEPGEGED